MKRILLLACMLISTYQLHAQSELTPIQFNDRLTAVTDSLYHRGQEWGKQFNDANASKNFQSLRPYRQSMERFINANISRIQAMKDVNNSKPLRTAMINFLRFELKMTTEAFQPLERYNASSNQASIDKAIKRIQELAKGENAELAKVAKAQETYAAENGFRIETEEEAKKKEPEQ